MDMAGIFKNKWVLIGGAGLGLVILLTKGGGATAAPSASGDPNAFILQYNASMAQNANASAEIAAGVTNNKLNVGLSQALGLMSFLATSAQTSAQKEMTDYAVDAGVTQTRILASTAMLADQENYLSKLTQTYTSANVATHVSDNQLTQVRVQAAASRSIAETQAQAAKKISKNNMIGNIAGAAIGGLTKIATGFIKP